MINKIYQQKNVSVIMPVYNQANFITRAIKSLNLQTLQSWELIIINDGSSDNLTETISYHLTDHRIKFIENNSNTGLGAALNRGLDNATFDLIAYLPADDIIYKDHLQVLAETFENDEDLILAYTGVKHHYNKIADGIITGYPLQLVQTMHRKTENRWVEREELVTDDLGRMFWNKLQERDSFSSIKKQITCEWVDHPLQRHKIIQEPSGELIRTNYIIKSTIPYAIIALRVIY